MLYFAHFPCPGENDLYVHCAQQGPYSNTCYQKQIYYFHVLFIFQDICLSPRLLINGFIWIWIFLIRTNEKANDGYDEVNAITWVLKFKLFIWTVSDDFAKYFKLNFIQIFDWSCLVADVQVTIATYGWETQGKKRAKNTSWKNKGKKSWKNSFSHGVKNGCHNIPLVLLPALFARMVHLIWWMMEW